MKLYRMAYIPEHGYILSKPVEVSRRKRRLFTPAMMIATIKPFIQTTKQYLGV